MRHKSKARNGKSYMSAMGFKRASLKASFIWPISLSLIRKAVYIIEELLNQSSFAIYSPLKVPFHTLSLLLSILKMDRSRCSSVDSLNQIVDSGYNSAIQSQCLPEVYFSRPHLKFINSKLRDLEPEGQSSMLPLKISSFSNIISAPQIS